MHAMGLLLIVDIGRFSRVIGEEQACRINKLEAADNLRGQEIEAIKVNMHGLVKSLQTHDQMAVEGEEALIKRIDRHRRALNGLEDDLRSLGVKHELLLEEVELAFRSDMPMWSSRGGV